MKKFKVSFEQEGLAIHVNGLSSTVIMVWQGRSDILHPEEQLSNFLIELIPSLRGRVVNIDLCSFSYMNSATFGPLLQFVRSLDRNMIMTNITFSSKREWQRVTYRCMKTISRSLSYLQINNI